MTFQELLYQLADYTSRTDIVNIPQLGEGTNSATLKTALAVTYSIAGTRYTKAATDNIAMTACTQQAISTYCLYLVEVNAAGTVTTKKGTSVATDTATLPTVDSANVALGAFKVQTNGATTFTSGTTDLSAAGLTVTYYDFDTLVGANAINMGMRKLERKYQFRHMRVRTTTALAVSSHTVTNPITNYKKLISAFAVDTNGVYIPLTKTSYRDAMNKYPNLTTDIGTPELIAEITTAETTLTPDIAPTHSLFIRPTTTASDSYTLDLYAYQYSPALDGCVYTTNWWTQNYPDLLLYGALAELEPYLINDQRLITWKTLFNDALKDLLDTEIMEELAGSNQNVESDYVV